MVRATRRMRSWERAVRPIFSKAFFISFSPFSSSVQQAANWLGVM